MGGYYEDPVTVGSLGSMEDLMQLLGEYASYLIISAIVSFVIWFVLACVGGTIAGKKGRSRAGWFFLIFFFGIIPFIIICCLKSKKAIVNTEDKWVCAKCNTTNNGGYTCSKCGAWKSNADQQTDVNAPITAEPTVAPVVSAQPVNTVTYTEQQPMPALNPNGTPWVCVCGQQNEPDAIYCCACGRVGK